MFSFLESQIVCVVREHDKLRRSGRVHHVSDRELRVNFDEPTELDLGDEVKILCGNDESFAFYYGSVIGTDFSQIAFWMSIENVVEGVSRAPRITAPGLTVMLSRGSQVWDASVCDLSASGMRLRVMRELIVGSELDLSMTYAEAEISLKVRVVREVESPDTDDKEYGLEVLTGDKLSLARYRHMIDALIRKAAVAA